MGPSQTLALFQLAFAAEFTSFRVNFCSARPLMPSLSNSRYRDSSAGAYYDAERLQDFVPQKHTRPPITFATYEKDHLKSAALLGPVGLQQA
jgi:hypothetical protein